MSKHTCECELTAKQYAAEEEEKYRRLDKVIDTYKGDKGVLIQVLHQAQEIFGWLPEDVQVRIAEGLGISLSEVYGVITFYSFFNTVPQGDHTIRVCLGTACYVRGGKQILEQFEKELERDKRKASAKTAAAAKKRAAAKKKTAAKNAAAKKKK